MPSFSPEMSSGGVPHEATYASEDWCLPEPGSKHFFNPEMTSMLKGVSRGTAVLFEEQFSRVADSVNTVQFNEIPGFELTREESLAHAVRFGELILSTVDGQKHAAHVAVKPFDTPREAAAEAGATQVVNGLPLQPQYSTRPNSFTPLGFLKEPSGATSLITRYDPEVITQDVTFWNPGQPPTEREVHQAFSHAAVALGGLHRHGYSHGDSQVKNIGGDFVGVRYVDLESMRRINSDHARERVYEDLGIYLTSLNARSSEDVDYNEPIADVLIPTYLRQIKMNGSQVPEEARLAPEEILELTEYIPD